MHSRQGEEFVQRSRGGEDGFFQKWQETQYGKRWGWKAGSLLYCGDFLWNTEELRFCLWDHASQNGGHVTPGVPSICQEVCKYGWKLYFLPRWQPIQNDVWEVLAKVSLADVYSWTSCSQWRAMLWSAWAESHAISMSLEWEVRVVLQSPRVERRKLVTPRRKVQMWGRRRGNGCQVTHQQPACTGGKKQLDDCP